MPESKYCQKCGLSLDRADNVIYECIKCRAYHCARATCGGAGSPVCGECGNTLRAAK